MAPDASDDGMGGGDKTRIGAAPPPQVKRTTGEKAPPTAAQSPPAGAGPDRTQVAGAPPPVPKPTAPATPPGDRTSPVIAPPPELATPRQPPAGPAVSAPAPSAPPPIQADAEEEGTVIITRSQSAAATLQRVQPPGHSEVIRLDRTSYILGRSHKCNVVLHSSSASREHARLTFRDAAWYVEPLGGKAVIANGVQVRGEQPLTHKMRLQLGGDELLFFDETAAASSADSRPAEPTPNSRRLSMLVAAAVVAALGVAAWWLFSNGSRLP